jgi:parallel beta-helix repeat protein
MLGAGKPLRRKKGEAMTHRIRNWGALLAVALCASAVRAETIIVDGTPIQDAVDLAQPGDTILVRPGIYTATPGSGSDAVVTVTKDDITLIGSHGAIIDATNFTFGIRVGELAPIGPEGCPPITVHGFTVKGFTFRNAEFSGTQLVGVEDFRLVDGRYFDNEEYGPFPICSKRGLISGNFASGHEDASIYIGDSDDVQIYNNTVSANVIGIEVENSTHVRVRSNHATGNTVGIAVIVLPDLPFPYTESVLIIDNVITANNFPNPIPPDSGDVIGLLPTGTGIFNLGADRVGIVRNTITHNNSFGIATVGNIFAGDDDRIEPFVDNNRTEGNVITDNGASPDPLRAFTPGTDIIFIFDVLDPVTGDLVLPDPNPFDNCYTDNEYGSDFPGGIVAAFPCD